MKVQHHSRQQSTDTTTNKTKYHLRTPNPGRMHPLGLLSSIEVKVKVTEGEGEEGQKGEEEGGGKKTNLRKRRTDEKQVSRRKSINRCQFIKRFMP